MSFQRNVSLRVALYAALGLSAACEDETLPLPSAAHERPQAEGRTKTTSKPEAVPPPAFASLAEPVTAAPEMKSVTPADGAPTVLTNTSVPSPSPAPADLDMVGITVDLKIASQVVERMPVEPETPLAVDDLVYAWTDVKGLDDGTIQHVWYKNGRELRRFDLPVENARRWRTWTIVKVKAGNYRVEVLGPGGELLAESAFEVSRPDTNPIDDVAKVDVDLK